MRFKDENEHPMAKQFVNDYFVYFFGFGTTNCRQLRYESEQLLSVDVFLKLLFAALFEMDVRSSAREGSGCSHQPS